MADSEEDTIVSRCSEELVDVLCTLCCEKHDYKRGINYCSDCADYFCQTCTAAHNKDHEQHTLISKEVDFPFINRETNRNKIYLVHRTQLLEMYCVDHDDIGCYMCISLEHRSCSKVRVISDSVENPGITIDPLTTAERLKMATLKMNGIKTNKDKILKELLASRKHSIDAVKDFRKDLEIVLDQLEKVSIKDIETNRV